MKILGLPLVCVAMFSVAGGHWALLQTVAWSQMIYQYSQASGSVVDGAKKTFSGEYPCAMCKKVAEGRQKEEKAPVTMKVDKKSEVFLFALRASFERPPARDHHYFVSPEADLAQLAYPPPVPVPIAVS